MKKRLFQDKELIFEPKAHVYSYDDRVAPSVTTVLDETGFIDTRFFNEATAGRGTIIHKITESYDKNELDWSLVTEEYFPYLNAYSDFMKKIDSILEIEKIVFNEQYFYAGQLDRILVLNGTSVIVDIKTGVSQKWHEVQLGGYAYAYAIEHNEGLMPIYCLHLKKDGNFSLKKHDVDKGVSVFLSAMNIYNWRKEN